MKAILACILLAIFAACGNEGKGHPPAKFPVEGRYLGELTLTADTCAPEEDIGRTVGPWHLLTFVRDGTWVLEAQITPCETFGEMWTSEDGGWTFELETFYEVWGCEVDEWTRWEVTYPEESNGEELIQKIRGTVVAGWKVDCFEDEPESCESTWSVKGEKLPYQFCEQEEDDGMIEYDE